MSFRYINYVCVCVLARAKMCQISYAYNNFEQLPKFVRREFLGSFPPAGTMARGVGDGEWGFE